MTFMDDIKNMCQEHLKCQECYWYDKEYTQCLFSGSPSLWPTEIINKKIRNYDEVLKALNVL